MSGTTSEDLTHHLIEIPANRLHITEAEKVELEKEDFSSKRETIRRQLAEGDDEEDPGLSGNNLLLCFLNETPSEAEDSDEDVDLARSKSARIPANHPLACLANHEGWDSDDSSATDNSLSRNPSVPGTPARFERVEGNISRKQGHVIIPLRYSEESTNGQLISQKPLADPRVNGGESNGLHLETSFFQQLANIQSETRRQLKEAKSLAVKTVEDERCERQIRDDIAKLLLSSPESLRYLKHQPGSSKLNRRILTPMNVSQLQVILNYLLTQIETLNENLVQYLIARDELAIEQDSLLTDIEDITKCIQGHDVSPF